MMRLRDLPVLVVDDNAVNRRILDATLRGWLMKPVLAGSGPAAVAAMEDSKRAGRIFPLVVLDAQMPGMDGLSVARAIRNDPGLAGVAMLMLTSAGQRADQARLQSLGIAACLTKPIGQAELLDAILVTLGVKSDAAERLHRITRQGVPASGRALRVLLAEDNKVNQLVAARLLEKHGHTVVVAGNGKEVLAALEEPGAGSFDLILMDVQMPEMGGFEATGIIRAREKSSGAHQPIIAMTAHTMKGDEERCLAAGMDGYLSKPIQVDQLFSAIDGLPA